MVDIKKGYHPQFDIDLKYGQECERLVAKMLLGFHEVKSDRKALKTGNLFIEFQSHGKPSGIETTQADWWTFHLHDGLCLVMDTEELKKHCGDKGVKISRGGYSFGNKGYLLPLKNILKW